MPREVTKCRHLRTGKEYEFLDKGMHKEKSRDEWVPAMFYRNADGIIFSTGVDRFSWGFTIVGAPESASASPDVDPCTCGGPHQIDEHDQEVIS